MRHVTSRLVSASSRWTRNCRARFKAGLIAAVGAIFQGIELDKLSSRAARSAVVVPRRRCAFI